MPHITVKPFDTSSIKKGQYGERKKTKVLFQAKDDFSEDELIAVEHEEESFLLHLKKKSDIWLLKYDKVTRPLKVNLLKEAIADIASQLELEVLQSNIAIQATKIELASHY